MNPATDAHTGALSEDGNVMIVGGGSRPGTSPVLQVYVRRSIDATNAALSGEYWVVLMSYDGSWASHTGVATIDGNGSGTLQVRFTDGTIMDDAQVEIGYAVAPNGKLNLDVIGPNPFSLVGGVTQDGRFAVAGGSTTAGAQPVMMIFVRK